MAAAYSIAVIGDWESVMGFRALGLDTYPVTSVEEARKTVHNLAKTDCAVIYLTETLAKDMIDVLDRYKDEIQPAIILIPGREGSLGIGRANIQSAIDRVIEARKKLDENTAFLDECRKNREDSKAKYMQVKALCGEFKAIYGQHCDTVRTMENVVRGSQSFLTSAIDNLTIVSKGYPFYAALMDSLLDGLPAEKKEE